MMAKQNKWRLLVLVGGCLVVFSLPVQAADCQDQQCFYLEYQNSQRTYNDVRHTFVTDRAEYNRTKSDLDLVKAQTAAIPTMTSRDQVMIAYIDWLSAIVQDKLSFIPERQTAISAELNKYKTDFQTHLAQISAVNDVTSWYASDYAYGTLRQRFDNFANNTFATIYLQNLKKDFLTYQEIFAQQSPDIISTAKDEVTRVSNQNELTRLERSLNNLKTNFADLETKGEAVQSKADYDAWKVSADAFLSGLVKDMRDFGSLWAN